MRWQSAIAIRDVSSTVTVNSKFTHTTANSSPTVPLISPMTGRTTMASRGDPAPDSPAADNRSAMPSTPDHVCGVGPPGAAHAAITRRTPSIEPVCIAVTSIAASCASAPSGVRGKPAGTSAGPTPVARGASRTSAAWLDTGPGSAASGSAVGMDAAANVSRCDMSAEGAAAGRSSSVGFG
jgi:hypothetical protein